MTVGLDRKDTTAIVENAHWRLGYRQDARYPGCLILSSQRCASDLNELDAASLADLGGQLSFAERLLKHCYAPHRVVFYKLGFSAGFSFHFHIAPITRALLGEIAAHPRYSDVPDGNDAILFLSREYGERALTPEERQAQEIEIARLRETANKLLSPSPHAPSQPT